MESKEQVKHTPGPWRHATTGTFGNVIEADSGRRDFDGDDGFRTVATFQACESTGMYINERENAKANARLIAAAPDLLEVLQEAVDGMGGSYALWAPKARAAIAKATGEKHE